MISQVHVHYIQFHTLDLLFSTLNVVLRFSTLNILIQSGWRTTQLHGEPSLATPLQNEVRVRQRSKRLWVYAVCIRGRDLSVSFGTGKFLSLSHTHMSEFYCDINPCSCFGRVAGQWKLYKTGKVYLSRPMIIADCDTSCPTTWSCCCCCCCWCWNRTSQRLQIQDCHIIGR